jgi:hypothetical protein
VSARFQIHVACLCCAKDKQKMMASRAKSLQRKEAKSCGLAKLISFAAEEYGGGRIDRYGSDEAAG